MKHTLFTLLMGLCFVTHTAQAQSLQSQPAASCPNVSSGQMVAIDLIMERHPKAYSKHICWDVYLSAGEFGVVTITDIEGYGDPDVIVRRIGSSSFQSGTNSTTSKEWLVFGDAFQGDWYNVSIANSVVGTGTADVYIHRASLPDAIANGLLIGGTTAAFRTLVCDFLGCHAWSSSDQDDLDRILNFGIASLQDLDTGSLTRSVIIDEVLRIIRRELGLPPAMADIVGAIMTQFLNDALRYY